MFIQTEETPNPNTMKFLPGQEILPVGTAEFKAADQTGRSPLAARLFEIEGVAGVFLARDFISVTKDEAMTWDQIKTWVLAAIMEHLTTGQSILLTPEKPKAKTGGSDLHSEIEKQIIELLEERVRPAVAADGGDIVFDRFEGGIVYLHMQGACAGCPSSTLTLKSGIENMLKHFVPEVEEVRPAEAY